MGNTNLKCNSCGHEFLGDEYTFSCPSCGGDSLVILNSETFLEKLKNFFYTNRIVASILAFALLVLGFWLWPSGPKSLNAEQSIDVLTFKKEKNHKLFLLTEFGLPIRRYFPIFGGVSYFGFVAESSGTRLCHDILVKSKGISTCCARLSFENSILITLNRLFSSRF